MVLIFRLAVDASILQLRATQYKTWLHVRLTDTANTLSRRCTTGLCSVFVGSNPAVRRVALLTLHSRVNGGMTSAMFRSVGSLGQRFDRSRIYAGL